MEENVKLNMGIKSNNFCVNEEKQMDEFDIQKSFYFPVCNKDEIERIFNIKNARDYLLKLRADTIIDNMRLFRVYRNKYIANEKNWSLEESFDDSHYKIFIKNLSDELREKSNKVTYGNIFSNNPNGKTFATQYGPIITISDSLTYFFKFMNLGLMDFNGRVPDSVCINSFRIAIRVFLRTEALDFLMDPRGIVPHDIALLIHSTIPYQMQFIAGHEFSHYLLDHLSESKISKKPIFYALFPNESDYKSLDTYNINQKQEFEADIQSIEWPNYNSADKRKILESALIFFGSLDIFESVLHIIKPVNPYYNTSHPSALDRYKYLLSNIQYPKGFNVEDWERFLTTIDGFRRILCKDISENPGLYRFYGSVYLAEPNTEWRGRRLIDRKDYY